MISCQPIAYRSAGSRGKPVQSRRCPATVWLTSAVPKNGSQKPSQITHLCVFSTTFEAKGVGTSSQRVVIPSLARSAGDFLFNASHSVCFMRKFLILISILVFLATGTHRWEQRRWRRQPMILSSAPLPGCTRSDCWMAASAALASPLTWFMCWRWRANPAGLAWTQPDGQSALSALAGLAPGYVFNDAGQAGKVRARCGVGWWQSAAPSVA